MKITYIKIGVFLDGRNGQAGRQAHSVFCNLAFPTEMLGPVTSR